MAIKLVKVLAVGEGAWGRLLTRLGTRGHNETEITFRVPARRIGCHRSGCRGPAHFFIPGLSLSLSLSLSIAQIYHYFAMINPIVFAISIQSRSAASPMSMAIRPIGSRWNRFDRSHFHLRDEQTVLSLLRDDCRLWLTLPLIGSCSTKGKYFPLCLDLFPLIPRSSWLSI